MRSRIIGQQRLRGTILEDTARNAGIVCEFCDEFTGGHQNAYSIRYGRTVRSILRTHSFCVFPSLGHIAEGHLLIAPLEHFCALADLREDRLEEIEVLRLSVRSVLTEQYGDCIFFEHGTRTRGAGGCGIDHAHMHALPVAAPGVSEILMRKFGGCSVRSFGDVREAVKEQSYLFFEDSSASGYVFPVKQLPSQYMRKLVAESIGKPDWDWRKCTHEPELFSTLERLTPLFSQTAIVVGE